MKPSNVLILQNKFDSCCLWQLLIHGYKHPEGPYCFDQDESGYLKGMFAGLDFILTTLDEPLTLDYLIKLHDQCVSNIEYIYIVETENGTQKYHTPMSLGIRKSEGTEFGLILNGDECNISLKGLKSLLIKIANGENYFTIDTPPNTCLFDHHPRVEEITTEYCEELLQKLQKQPYRISIKVISQNKLQARIKLIIDEYHQTIKEAATQEDKLKAIVTCIHELELTHPFTDGNCRTIAVLLLNKLLLQNQFDPIMLISPDRFDAFSVDELVTDIQNQSSQDKISAKPLDPNIPCLYLYGNLAICRLFAIEALQDQPNWKTLSSSQKTSLLRGVSPTLATINQPLSSTDISSLKKLLIKALNRSTVKISIPFFKTGFDLLLKNIFSSYNVTNLLSQSLTSYRTYGASQ